MNGVLSLKAEGEQLLLKLDMGTANFLEPKLDELVQTKPRAQDETLHHEGTKQEDKVQETSQKPGLSQNAKLGTTPRELSE